MALMLGHQQIGDLAAFAGWNSIQKKVRMRDVGISALVYDFYVRDGVAVLSSELDVLEADTADAERLQEEI